MDESPSSSTSTMMLASMSLARGMVTAERAAAPRVRCAARLTRRGSVGLDSAVRWHGVAWPRRNASHQRGETGTCMIRAMEVGMWVLIP
eukprot:3328951-Pleurochrysis_carterae.AAC.1